MHAGIVAHEALGCPAPTCLLVCCREVEPSAGSTVRDAAGVHTECSCAKSQTSCATCYTHTCTCTYIRYTHIHQYTQRHANTHQGFGAGRCDYKQWGAGSAETQGEDIIARAEQAHELWDRPKQGGGPGSVLLAGMAYGAEVCVRACVRVCEQIGKCACGVFLR